MQTRTAASFVSFFKSFIRPASVLAVLTATLSAPGLAAEEWPDKVAAKYKITFNGIDIGDFRFQSSADAHSYDLAGKASLSLMLGALKWKAETASKGVLAKGDPRPAEFSFTTKEKKKNRSVFMSFKNDKVADRVLKPPSSPSKNTVPLIEEHLKGVLDPLSAIMAMTRGVRSNPCEQKVAIFDGKYRFDLVLSYLRKERIKEAKPSGEPEFGYVCRVRYVPIAGHKSDSKTVRSLAQNDGIEVVLRPIPSANIFIPYQITVPVFAGWAVLKSERVDITTPVRQIALVH